MPNKFNILDCDPACTSCIKGYKKKHNLKQGDIFNISCHGIPKDYINSSLIGAEGVSANSILDPVAWAAEVLDWHCEDPDGSIWKRKTAENTLDEVTPYIEEKYSELIKQGKSAYNRPYQKTMLSCTAKRKIFRLGRQCVDSNTLITMSDGSIKPIKDIKINDNVMSLDLDTYKIIPANVFDIFSTGVNRRYEVHTQGGHTVITTADHPFLVKRGIVDNRNNKHINDLIHEWLTIDNGLKNGDKVAISNLSLFEDVCDNPLYGDNYLRLIGYFSSEGSFGKNQSLKFTNTSKQYLDEWIADCAELGSDCKLYSKWDGNPNHEVGIDAIVSNGRHKKNPVRELFQYAYGRVYEEKILPEFIWSLSYRQIGLLLNRMFSGDGWVEITKRKDRNNKLRCALGIGDTSMKMLQQVQALLLKCGVGSHIRQECDIKYKRPFYKLHISQSRNILKLFKLTGYFYGKENQCEIAKQCAEIAIENDGLCTENNIDWDYIKSIKQISDGETYDISLDHKHIFIANSAFYLKNCGKTETICVAILYSVFTNKDFRVIVIAPYQTQIELIFNRLSKLINSSEITKNSIKRYVKAPNHTIELYNGSSIRGLTAGTKSGGNADSVRGSKANMLVFEEADYLNSADMASALAVITNYPDATVWMSSTPTGKHERFYECAYSPLWKEFHYPSQVNPLWNDDLEAFFRGELSDIEYNHEVLAEFGQQAEGIYQNQYVEDALEDYKYDEFKRIDGWSYCIGVDWNDTKVGTTIAVIGYNPSTNTFKLVYRTIVSRAGWTQLDACQRIAELNRQWKPEWIYVDKGFGSTQHEILTKYGYDSLQDPNKGKAHPDSRLMRIVKAYDFSSKVVIKDLFTRQDKEKHAKPFLIENSVRRFEQRQIKISKYDEQLQEELRGYVIDHITSTGLPVYKASEKAGDHNLDALNLALVAFTLEMSPFGHVRHDNNIAFVGNLGETKQPDLPPARQTEQQKSITSKPDMKRTKIIEGPKTPEPAVVSNNTRRLWSWPGFERDAPRPNRRESTFSTGRPQLPSRKKF